MQKSVLALFIFMPLSCTKAAEQEVEIIKDYSPGLHSTILCEEIFETCGVQGFTEWGVPVLMVSDRVSDYFAPYGILMWEMSPALMTNVWTVIEDYDLAIAWIGVLPLEKKLVPKLTERVEFRQERRAWIRRVTEPIKDMPEKWLRLPPKPEKKKRG